MGYSMKEHREGVVFKGEKQADHDSVMRDCPRARDQIRSVKFHHLGAKGPVYARSFIRKVLGNEGAIFLMRIWDRIFSFVVHFKCFYIYFD